MPMSEIKKLVDEDIAWHMGETPAILVWNMQSTMFDIADYSEEYFEDFETANLMYQKIAEAGINGREVFANDPFLPELIYQELLSYSYTYEYEEMKVTCEELMLNWPDYRMMWAIEDFYEEALENLE